MTANAPILKIEASAKKVPKERDEILIEFKATKIIDSFIAPILFKIMEEDFEVLENAQPEYVDLNDLPFYSYFKIKLKKEMPYRIRINAISNDFYIQVDSNSIYARLLNGNALILSEREFNHFKNQYYIDKKNQKLSEKAIEILNNVKVAGLKIAIENWEHNEKFHTVENSEGFNAVIIQEDPYEMALIEEALSNPNYKDNAIIEMTAPSNNFRYIAEIDTNPMPLPPPNSIGINKIIKVHFSAKHSSNQACLIPNNIV